MRFMRVYKGWRECLEALAGGPERHSALGLDVIVNHLHREAGSRGFRGFGFDDDDLDFVSFVVLGFRVQRRNSQVLLSSAFRLDLTLCLKRAHHDVWIGRPVNTGVVLRTCGNFSDMTHTFECVLRFFTEGVRGSLPVPPSPVPMQNKNKPPCQPPHARPHSSKSRSSKWTQHTVLTP